MEEKEIKNKKISSSQDNKSLKKNDSVGISDEKTGIKTNKKALKKQDDKKKKNEKETDKKEGENK